MTKPILLCVLTVVAAFPQAQTPLTITQSAGSATGELRMQERRTNGQNYVGLRAPQSVAANTVWTLPDADGTSGQCLQTDGAGVMSWAACGSGYATLHASDYDWSQTITAPGAAGTHTITLTPGPLGVIATDTASQYWLSGTAGADEYVTSTGTGTCDGTGQASCTIEVTTANSHTGTTTIRSASAGAQEAINANATSVTLLYGNEAVTWHACVYLNNHNVVFAGQGRGSSITLATPSQRGICKLTAGYLEVRNISIIGDGTTTGIYAQASVSNAGSDRIDSSFFQSHAKAINHRVVSETWITRNLFYGNTVDLETVNEVSNDQGGLVVSENNFLSDGTSSSKSVWYHGPGGAWFHKNAFTGARDSFYADGLMATVNTSGTAVTATDGRFYSGMVGGSYYINGVTYTVAAYVDSTHLTLSTSAGTQTGVAFGQSTGQFHFEDNNFDNQNRTGVWFDGAIYFGGVNLRGNTFSNFYGSEQYTAIKITNPAIDAVMIADNKFGNLAGTTFDHTGIYASYSGTNLSITGNTFLAHKYSINLDFGGTTNATDTLISGNTFKGGAESGTIAVRMRNALRATLAANSIYNYITGVDIANASSAEIAITGGKITCPASGTGIAVDAATSVSINAVDFGTACTTMTALSGGATVSSNSTTGTATNRYTASGSSTIRDNAPESATILSTGTNDTAAIGSIARYTTGTAAANFGVQQSITLENASGAGITAGGWQFRWADASNMYPQYDFLISKNNGGLVIGASLDTNKNWISYGSLYSSIGSVTGRFGADLNSGAGIGTFSAHPLSLYTDSAARWVVTSAGMMQPASTDTYDIGDLTTPKRVRGVYSKIVDTALSGGTGDYLQTRKIQLFDNTGSSTGASYWDMNVVMSGVGAGQNSYFYLRDNGGNTVWRADKIASGSAVATTTIYTDLLPDSTANVRKLGKTTQRWDEINGASLDLTGAANITGNLSAAVINATGSPAYRVSGTTVINASRAATFTDLTINTSSAPAVGDVWTATSTGGAGSWQASDSSKWTAGSGSNIYRSAGSVGINTSDPQGLIDVFSASNVGTSPLISMRSDFAAAGRFGGIRFGDQSQTSLYQKGAIYYESVATSARGKIHIALEATDTSTSVGLSDARLTITQSGIEVPGGSANIGGTLTATNLVVNTGAATVGYVWTATSTGGAGAWQASTASQWTTAGSNIYRLTGKVAIGSSAPNYELDVVDNTSGTTNLIDMVAITRSTTGTAAAGLGGALIWVLEDGGGNLIATNKISSIWTNASTGTRAARMDFYSATANTSSIAMSIASDGKVGIQQTSPASTLDITGTLNVTSTANIGGKLTVSGGSSLWMDRAARNSNQQMYWTVAGNTSTTGAWSMGTVPNGAASTFWLAHNGTAVWTAVEGGQVDFAGTGTFGGSLTVTGTASAAAFNGTGSAPFRVAGTTVIDSSRNASIVGLTITGRITGDVLPATDGGYVSGSTSFRWGSLATYNADFNGVLTFQSGTTFTGSLLPTTNNLYALGNSSFRLSNISTVNANFSGTLTAPNGNTGYSGTVTVRDAAGTGTCTNIYSGGLRTGGTC